VINKSAPIFMQQARKARIVLKFFISHLSFWKHPPGGHQHPIVAGVGVTHTIASHRYADAVQTIALPWRQFGYTEVNCADTDDHKGRPRMRWMRTDVS
jgi:hypothetical protein